MPLPRACASSSPSLESFSVKDLCDNKKDNDNNQDKDEMVSLFFEKLSSSPMLPRLNAICPGRAVYQVCSTYVQACTVYCIGLV